MATNQTKEAVALEKIKDRLADIEKRLGVLEKIAKNEDTEINERIESISKRVDDIINSIRMG